MSIESGENVNQDVLRLESLGYRQELRRKFSAWKVFCVAFSIMGIGPSLASVIFYNLPYGGPISMVWGWIIAATCITFVGLALGDLASSMPTSGGLYYWTHKMGHPRYRNFLSWMVGYNSLLGNLSASSSLAWACGNQIMTGVAIHNPDFTPTASHYFGIYCAVLIFCGIYCAYFTPVFARLGTASVILNLVIAAITIIGLPIARRHDLNTAHFTFAGWVNQTGWGNGFTFFLSWLAPVWTIASFDCTVSISEEASNASTAVPLAMFSAITSGGLVGALLLIVFTLCMGTDLDAVANTTLGNPLAYIYVQGFGKTGALVVWILICIAQMSMTASVVFPASRQAFAFARDGALPFAKFLYKVDSWTKTPVRTVWFIVFCAIPFGALGFADPVNYAAINAIFALSIIGLYAAYAIPIVSRLVWGGDVFKPGPWYTGRFSKGIAIFALCYMAFASVIFCFPAEPQFDAGSMNYACVVLVGVWTFAAGFYFFPKYGGRTFFDGPRTIDMLDYTLNDGEYEHAAGIAAKQAHMSDPDNKPSGDHKPNGQLDERNIVVEPAELRD